LIENESQKEKDGAAQVPLAQWVMPSHLKCVTGSKITSNFPDFDA
jgi:hypothetical protein